MTLLWLRIAVLLYGIAALAVLPAALYNRPRWRHIAMPCGTRCGLLSLRGAGGDAERRAPRPARRHARDAIHARPAARRGVSRPCTSGTAPSPSASFCCPSRRCSRLCPPFAPAPKSLDYPLLHTGWLFLHVALLLAAYAALLISLIASVLYLVQETPPEAEARLAGPQLAAPPLETTDQIALKSLLFGLPCMTAGLLIGSVVALETIGPDVLRRPQGSALARDVGRLHRDDLHPPSLRPARTPRDLSLGLRLSHRPGRLGGQSALRRAQVQSAMSEQTKPGALLLVGVNHTTAPLDVRERLAIPDDAARRRHALARRAARHSRSAHPLHLQSRRAADRDGGCRWQWRRR